MMRTAFAAAAVLMLSACATPAQGDAAAQADERDCFSARHVNGFNVIDENHVMVRVGASRRYILTTDFDTHGVEWDNRIALRSPTGMICTGEGGTGLRLASDGRDFAISSIERAPEPASQPG